MLLTIFVAAMAVMLISLIGVILTQKAAGNFLEKNISKLISFAAGVFLVTALVLAQEVYHLIDSSLLSVGLIIVGYGLAWTMHILIPESHHHHIVCEQCGALEDIENCNQVSLQKEILKHSKSFKVINSHSLEFFGICKNCGK